MEAAGIFDQGGEGLKVERACPSVDESRIGFVISVLYELEAVRRRSEGGGQRATIVAGILRVEAGERGGGSHFDGRIRQDGGITERYSSPRFPVAQGG